MTGDGSPAERLRVEDRAEDGRFEGYVDGELVGVVEYRSRPGQVLATHTEVPSAWEGQGVASALVAAFVDQLRADGRMLRSYCPYVTAWLRRHPEAADVVDDATP